jgi:hypothetical protein
MSALAAMALNDTLGTNGQKGFNRVITENVSIVASNDVLYAYHGDFTSSDGVQDTEQIEFSASGTVAFVHVTKSKKTITWTATENGIIAARETTEPTQAYEEYRHVFYVNVKKGKKYIVSLYSANGISSSEVKGNLLVCGTPVFGVVECTLS